MSANIIREITPLTQNDCFTMFSRVKKEFTFPLHYHEELELNLSGAVKSSETNKIGHLTGAKILIGGSVI